MGIDNFHTWLRNTYPSAISNYNKKSYDHVYIDLNYVLHRIVSYVSSEDELLEKVVNAIISIIIDTKPRKTLNLVADGSASYAKIILQKKRRLQTVQSLIEKSIEAFDVNKISPLQLTPGTSFMNKFNKTIKEFVNEKLHSIFNDDTNINLVANLNLSDIPDEAEFKIGRYIRQNTQSLYDTHVIYSKDADMVLIAMALTEIYGIEIMIPQTFNECYVISIDELIEQQMEMYGYNMLKRVDFSLISLLNGNDYFPKLKCSNIDRLWKSYKDAIQPHETIMQNNNTINIKMLVKFLTKLINNCPKRNQNTSLDDLQESNVSDYLTGIQWCISLYSTGEYLTYDYIYNGKSINPEQILLYILINNINKINVPMTQCIKIPSNLYTVLVLPYAAKQLIPSEFHKIIDNKLKYIYNEEHCETCKIFREHLLKHSRNTIENNKDNDNKDNNDKKSKDYSMKNYSIHRRKHIIKHPKEYIQNIIRQLSFINST